MNCIIVDDDELSRSVIEDLVNEMEVLDLIASCDNAMEAYHFLKNNQIDLAFVDIQMPKINGMELVKNLSSSTQIILITSHSEYASESYEYEVTDFIVKPVSPARFLKAIEKARKQSEAKLSGAGSGKLFIRSDSRLVQLDPKHILYVEALGNYVNIHTDKEKLTVHFTMKEIETRLSSESFIRVHRSFIVKLDRIEAIEDNTIEIGGKQIGIGRAYKEVLIKRLQMF